MLERLLGTRCSSVSVWVRLSSLISSKGPKVRREPEKTTSSVDLMKNKLTLKLHSQELLLKPALGLPVSHIIYKIPHCCYWPGLSVCSQVSEPRAGCHGSGHSWRIHLSFGMPSSSSRRFRWAFPCEELNMSTVQTAQNPLLRNVSKDYEKGKSCCVGLCICFFFIFCVIFM